MNERLPVDLELLNSSQLYISNNKISKLLNSSPDSLEKLSITFKELNGIFVDFEITNVDKNDVLYDVIRNTILLRLDAVIILEDAKFIITNLGSPLYKVYEKLIKSGNRGYTLII